MSSTTWIEPSVNHPLCLLMVYARARQENLTAEEKKLAAILKS
jgi:hypothetical protein